MGALEEFKSAVQFLGQHKIIPTVHQSYLSLDKTDEAITALKDGTQFGKIVVNIGTSTSSSRL